MTIAGNGTAGSTSTLLRNPQHAVVHPTSGVVYVADTGNYCIRKIGDGGVLTTVAGVCRSSGDVGGALGTNKLTTPTFLLFSKDGTKLYFADSGSHRVKEMLVSSGWVSSLVGDGTAGCSSTRLNNPSGLALDPTGKTMYIACSGELEIANFPAGMHNVVTASGSIVDPSPAQMFRL